MTDQGRKFCAYTGSSATHALMHQGHRHCEVVHLVMRVISMSIRFKYSSMTVRNTGVFETLDTSRPRSPAHGWPPCEARR